ncbi:hypothetical protein MNBD_IGNAVI01-987 [hydrothermal vent metagenome]|uniref:SMP-30/Gluconolactonase/LRE-like region domain-containing protein n=1 Tax=hydrothermal vent metagenome TaxID=652676 RepID=A0A3B1CMP7_9ZZZZ
MKKKLLFICVIAAALFVWSCNEKSPVAPDFANQSQTLDKRVHVPVGTVTSLLELPTGYSPEGIVIDKRGNMYISNTIGADRGTNQILRVRRNGSYSVYTTLPGSGQARGLVAGKRGKIFVAFATSDPNTNGVYSIKRNGTPVRLRGSEGMLGPNALTFDARGNLYCTDSDGGSVWKYGRNRRFVKWAEDLLLAGGIAPGGPPFPLPGANGIAFYPPNKLYVANTMQNSINLIRIGHNGQALGVESVKSDFLLMNVDGIAVDVHENIYAVLPPSTLGFLNAPPLPPLVMLNPNTGVVTPIVTHEGAADFNTPTSLVFGTGGPWNRRSVFIANAALQYGQPMEPWAAPGVVEVYVGKPGMPCK